MSATKACKSTEAIIREGHRALFFYFSCAASGTVIAAPTANEVSEPQQQHS
jgi:hypothetical protein